MDRAFESAALVTPPTPPASPSLGYPTNGNPGTGTPATIPGDWWYHMLTEELRNVIVAAGLTPDQTAVNQLLQALPGALASRPEMARSLTANGYQKLPGRLILQWGTASIATSGTYVTLPIAFPTAFLACVMGVSSAGIPLGAAYCYPVSLSQLVVDFSNMDIGTCTWFAVGF